MKIYSLEFVSKRDGVPERIWHTNRRALARYARTLEDSSFDVRGIRTFDLPTPPTEARLVAFLNAHCANFLPPRTAERAAGRSNRRRTPGVN